jgi:hypothetical protein
MVECQWSRKALFGKDADPLRVITCYGLSFTLSLGNKNGGNGMESFVSAWVGIDVELCRKLYGQ